MREPHHPLFCSRHGAPKHCRPRVVRVIANRCRAVFVNKSMDDVDDDLPTTTITIPIIIISSILY